MNTDIFRQYDIRGQAERDLTDEVVTLLGRAFGTYVQERGAREVFVGRDNRLSPERLRNAFVAGLVSAGCRVVDIGLVVTPILYYAEVACRPAGAVMITASHNPPEDNGFKLVCRGNALYGEEILRLKTKIQLGPRSLKVVSGLRQRQGLSFYRLWGVSYQRQRREISGEIIFHAYRVIYCVDRGRVLILAIIHCSRDLRRKKRSPGKLFKFAVVYRESSKEDGFVITAFLTRRRKQLEKRRKMWEQ